MPPSPAEAEVLLQVVSEKTGYPVDMLELDMQLDADLGIDSIKRVEILSAIQDRLPEAPAVKPEHLGSIRTLRQIADFLAQAPQQSPAATIAPMAGTSPKPLALPTAVLKCLVPRAVPISAADKRKRVSMAPAGEIWLTDDGSSLTEAIRSRLHHIWPSGPRDPGGRAGASCPRRRSVGLDFAGAGERTRGFLDQGRVSTASRRREGAPPRRLGRRFGIHDGLPHGRIVRCCWPGGLDRSHVRRAGRPGQDGPRGMARCALQSGRSRARFSTGRDGCRADRRGDPGGRAGRGRPEPGGTGADRVGAACPGDRTESAARTTGCSTVATWW